MYAEQREREESVHKNDFVTISLKRPEMGSAHNWKNTKWRVLFFFTIIALPCSVDSWWATIMYIVVMMLSMYVWQ